MSATDAAEEEDRPEIAGAELALRCYELNELAARVQRELRDDLARLGTEQSVYRFTDRLKGSENIQNKVLRIREEAQFHAKREARPHRFHPEDITDAWGCRFVTLFQTQIVDVMVHVLRQIEAWRRDGRAVLIEVIDIYTNRPDQDPNSIAPRAAQRIESFGLASFRSASRPFEIKHRVDSRDSGYSAIHIVLFMTLHRRVLGNEVADTVKFEIQIRDLFEEAWSQVSHAVSYGRKDGFFQTGVRPNSTVEILARPQLNALKAVADGCSQFAEQIRRTYDDLRGRLSTFDPKSTYLSVVPLREVRDFILKSIPPEREVLIDMIKTAYGLLQDARDSADKHFDNRVPRANYLAAAGKFAEAIDRAHETLDVVLPDTKTIEWYLKIEQANALIFSLPATLRRADEEQLACYHSACGLYDDLETKFGADHVVQLRRAQAERKAVRSDVEAQGTIKRLEYCLRLLRQGEASLEGESALTDQLVRIELGLARLDYSEYAASRDAKEAALREAVKDVQAIVPAELPAHLEPETARTYRRALSNVLWFFHRLQTNAGVALQETEKEIVRGNLELLRGPIFWPTVRFYAETIENLMYGYKLIDRIAEANEMAALNLALLRDMANDRRKLDDNRDVTELLEEDEKDLYLRATDFLREHAIVGPLGGSRS